MVIGTMHVLLVAIALFNGIPVVLKQKKLACRERVAGTISDHLVMYVVELDCCASVLLYEFMILSSNYSMA